MNLLSMMKVCVASLAIAASSLALHYSPCTPVITYDIYADTKLQSRKRPGEIN